MLSGSLALAAGGSAEDSVPGPERFQRPGRNVSLGFDWTF